MDNMDWIEYSPTQILSGIKKLKNIIKYKKPYQPQPQPDQPQLSHPQQQPKFNQHIRTMNIKQSDWTYKKQVIEDLNIQQRTSLDNIKPLSTNYL